MKGRIFIDTNILIYADDADAGVKRKKAQQILHQLIASSQAVFSTQVLSEFFVIAVKKLNVSPEKARRKVELLSRLEVVSIRPDLVLSAIDLHYSKKLSFWDALIVRSAADAGCTQLLSDDLNHGQIIDGVTIKNPFR